MPLAALALACKCWDSAFLVNQGSGSNAPDQGNATAVVGWVFCLGQRGKQ